MSPLQKTLSEKTKSSGMSKGKVSLDWYSLVAAFFVGTGYGVYVMSTPSNNSSNTTLTVNDNAFPILNNTTTNTTKTNSTASNKTSATTKTTTATSSKKNTSTSTTTKSQSLGNSTG